MELHECELMAFTDSTFRHENISPVVQQPPRGPRDSSLSRLHDHTQTHTHSLGLLWTSDQLVAETYTDNTHSRQTSIPPPLGFEPAIPASERPQTYALDCAATGTGETRNTFCWDVVINGSLSTRNVLQNSLWNTRGIILFYSVQINVLTTIGHFTHHQPQYYKIIHSSYKISFHVLYSSQEKQRLFPCGTLTDCFVTDWTCVHCAVRVESLNKIVVNFVCKKAVWWLRRLVASLSVRKPGFGPRWDYASFVVNKVALGFIFLRVLRIFYKAILFS